MHDEPALCDTLLVGVLCNDASIDDWEHGDPGGGSGDPVEVALLRAGSEVGSGTDVAKQASEIVITDDDFASVYAAVEEGRTAFNNIRMATLFLLSTGAAVVLVILTTLALDWPIPLLAAQILWLNVITNGIADVALAFEPGDRSLFERDPRPMSEQRCGTGEAGTDR